MELLTYAHEPYDRLIPGPPLLSRDPLNLLELVVGEPDTECTCLCFSGLRCVIHEHTITPRNTRVNPKFEKFFNNTGDVYCVRLCYVV